MSEKRRHERVVHRDVVRVDAAGTTFKGYSVDISRTGLQIEVAVPYSFDRIEKVRFSLPEIASEVALPVRVARRDSDSNGRGHRILALEFLADTDPQLRLIERYIRSLKEREHPTSDETTESRRIPRVDCALPARIDAGVQDVVIENISTEGILIAGTGDVAPHQPFTISFTLPEDTREIRATGTVAYVVTGTDDSVRFGAPFTELSTVHRARIVRFIENATAFRSLRSVHSSFDDDMDTGYHLVGEDVVALFKHAGNVSFYVLVEGNTDIHRGSLWSGADAVVSETVTSETMILRFDESLSVRDSDTLLVSFTSEGSNHYFSTAPKSIETMSDGSVKVVVATPKRVHRSDNRSTERRPADSAAQITLHIGGSEAEVLPYSGELINISRRGLRCRIVIPSNRLSEIAEGSPVTYRTTADIQMPLFGRIRHVAITRNTDQMVVAELGIEAGIKRGHLDLRTLTPEEWSNRIGRKPGIQSISQTPTRSHRIAFTDREGRRIVGLINRVDGNDDPLVVIVPPAFGKKKETLAPLAASICANFSRVGSSVVVLRYDGINRPGESYNEIANPLRGYEMLSYRPSQGVEDMRAALDYVHQNALFRPSRVVLVTTSMSSVDARKLLLTEGNRVSAWVSLMGVPAARTTLMNVLAGTDIIANAQAGISNGVRGMLGHFVDMDRLAWDLIDQKYAYIADARFDLARISVPIFWILGTYDHWVDPAEVEDIMSIESGYPRRLQRIPVGHNLRTSDDAAEAFRMITSYCLETADVSGDAVAPPRDTVLRMIESEREAVFRPLNAPEVSAYWNAYLLGDETNSEGYDFYAKLREFRAFVTEEVELIDPRLGERIADVGCGTGLVTERLLSAIAEQVDTNQQPPESTCVHAVDLVADALERTQEKCERIIAENPQLEGISLRYTVSDLEPDRYAPIRDFVNRHELPIGFLRGRVEGLRDRVIDDWEAADVPALAAFLRGETTHLPDGINDEPIAQDLHRAARWVSGKESVRSPAFTTLSFGAGITPGDAEKVTDLGMNYDAIVASLFISYVLNPDYLLWRFHRMLRPGGRILVSSMRPDSDVSKIFTNYIEQLDSTGPNDQDLHSARSMLNEAASLFELEEDGYFRFYTEDELEDLLRRAGFRDIRLIRSLGDPPQGIIATARAVSPPPGPWSTYV